MKTFTVTTRILQGLPFESSPYPHVPVGEPGRGRVLTRFPVGRRLAESLQDVGRIERADVLRTDKGTLLLVEERRLDDRRALVLAGVPAGYRGIVHVWAAGPQHPCPDRGAELYQRCHLCGAMPEADAYGSPRHPDSGESEWWLLLSPAGQANARGVTVLAAGRCAQGEAGRMGGHPELLLLLEPGARLLFHRHGRTYGAPKWLLLVWDGAELRFGPPDEVEPPVEEVGEVI